MQRSVRNAGGFHKPSMSGWRRVLVADGGDVTTLPRTELRRFNFYKFLEQFGVSSALRYGAL